MFPFNLTFFVSFMSKWENEHFAPHTYLPINISSICIITIGARMRLIESRKCFDCATLVYLSYWIGWILGIILIDRVWWVMRSSAEWHHSKNAEKASIKRIYLELVVMMKYSNSLNLSFCPLSDIRNILLIISILINALYARSPFNLCCNFFPIISIQYWLIIRVCAFLYLFN